MQRLIGAFLLLAMLVVLQSKAFAASLNCSFADGSSKVEGIETLQVNEEALIINGTQTIVLERSPIRCGRLKNHHRFDGLGKGLQIILKSCAQQGVLDGQILDSANGKVSDIICE